MEYLYDNDEYLNERLTYQFGLYLRKTDREALDRLSDIMDCSRAEVVREAIRVLALRFNL